MYFRILLVIFFTGIYSLLSAQDTCRFMTYNVLNFDYTGNSKEIYLRTTIDSIRPDILVVQEINYATGANRFRDSVVLKVDTGYAMGTFIDSYDTDNAIFYKKNKYTFISNTPIKTDLRDINQFKLMHKSDSTYFYVYSVHLKASSGTSNEVLRRQEVDSLRKYTALLPDTANYIVAGDFNIYKSSESAYVGLTDSTNSGFFIDPLKAIMTGTWNNAAYAQYHTQSTRVRAFGGGSTGGLDDRFDLVLYSKGIRNAGGMEYITGSLKALGNDGDHYNDSLNAIPNTAASAAIINALYQTSDHIPVLATFVFANAPAPSLCMTAPDGLFADNITSSSAKVHWDANEEAIKYKVSYKVSGTLFWHKLNAVTNTKTIKSLSPSTTYVYRINTICSGGISGPFSSIQTFTTLPFREETETIEPVVNLFPNPASGHLSVTCNQPVQKIFVMNVLGELIKEISVADIFKFDIDITELQAGIYLIQLQSGSEFVTSKFIKL